MIRQIWKVRNTENDPVEKTPLATEESSAAQVTKDDESQRERVNSPQDKPDRSLQTKDADVEGQKKEKRSALLNKASGATLSVCTYDPKSATVYALVEQSAPRKMAPNKDSPAQNEEEKKEGTPSTTKALPGIL
jgi:hypothetical protein